MEVLQKLTLYDLLGYALPGAALLIIYGQDDLDALFEEGVKGGVLLLLFGFLTGVVLSEIMQWVERGLRKIREDKRWSKLCEDYSLTAERMEQALKNARMIQTSDTNANHISLEECKNYRTAAYADIQTDPKYSRIHNYASAALMYKNMVPVAVLTVVHGIWKGICPEIWIGLIASLCFFVRWMRFQKKKVGYALCWFADKYRDEAQAE